jgi:hypothetical protein
MNSQITHYTSYHDIYEYGTEHICMCTHTYTLQNGYKKVQDTAELRETVVQTEAESLHR